ncbi:hypothetical protein [Paludifilum halophilum]|uniref:hypothetical protein n=1 Tax=Paludifilum halophilum TaxID=1642702 RepID=UPI0011406C44|nr:hypothetical protein [Paludifilum halophilum]
MKTEFVLQHGFFPPLGSMKKALRRIPAASAGKGRRARVATLIHPGFAVRDLNGSIHPDDPGDNGSPIRPTSERVQPDDSGVLRHGRNAGLQRTRLSGDPSRDLAPSLSISIMKRL